MAVKHVAMLANNGLHHPHTSFFNYSIIRVYIKLSIFRWKNMLLVRPQQGRLKICFDRPTLSYSIAIATVEDVTLVDGNASVPASQLLCKCTGFSSAFWP
jgi:hypothetical protein